MKPEELAELIRKANAENFNRAAPVDVRALDEDARTVEIAFSSEEPYDRWFGTEILGHKKVEVRLDRLKGGAALLMDHNTSDQVGVVDSARIDKDGVGRAVVRFSKSARGSEVFQDVKDGIRKLISVGYRIHEMVLEKATDDQSVYRVTDWEPHEVSIVSVPADTTVGVGRSVEPATIPTPPKVNIEMDDKEKARIDAERTEADRVAREKREAADVAERAALLKETREAETRRIRSIESLGVQFGQPNLAREYIEQGGDVNEFIDTATAAARANPNVGSRADIGLTEKETKTFSVCRMLLALSEPSNRAAQEAAAFELESSAAAVDMHVKSGAEAPRGMVLPAEVMRSSFMGDIVALRNAGALPPRLMGMARTLTAGTATDGAELVATDLLAGSFIDVLRNASMVMAAGATTLPDLVGNVAIPRKTTGSTGGWLATEGADGAESEPQFDQVTLTPKTVAAWLEYTRQLVQQSTPGIEALVRMDLAMGLATTLDTAALYGTGSSGQPTGISLTAGINTPTAFAGVNPTYAEVIAMESDVATDNALMGSLSYMLRPDMRGVLKSTEKASGTAQFVWEPGNTLNGYSTFVTNQVVAGDVFFGNWSDLLIGMWGGLDMLVDPYSNSKSGKIRVSVFQSMDLAVRHPVSFCFNNDT